MAAPPVRRPALCSRRWHWPAPIGTRGHPRLRAPLALRLVDRDRRTVHAFQLRPATEHLPAAVRLLRKADGTAFVLHDASSGIVRPEQRLELRYRRDDRANRPDAPVLTEQGVEATEIAVLRART